MDPAALDAVSRLLLAEAPADAQRVALVDTAADLDDAAAQRWEDVRSYRDRLDAGPSVDTLTEAVTGADLVLLALPKSLGALEEIAQVVAVHAAPGVRLVAAGRVKHMTPTQNTVLARSFGDVRASRGVGKCRALHASDPRPTPLRWPRSAVDPVTGLELVAHGATFGGTRLDDGTRLLLATLPGRTACEAIDLGSGNGVIATTLALQGHAVTAVDVSRAAIASTRETLQRNDARGSARLADGLSSFGDHSADLVVSNPPFHIGTAKDSTPTLQMIADAPRVLRPGGELWLVFNSHLPYLRAAREAFGDARIVDRDREFSVLVAVSRG